MGGRGGRRSNKARGKGQTVKDPTGHVKELGCRQYGILEREIYVMKYKIKIEN